MSIFFSYYTRKDSWNKKKNWDLSQYLFSSFPFIYTFASYMNWCYERTQNGGHLFISFFEKKITENMCLCGLYLSFLAKRQKKGNLSDLFIYRKKALIRINIQQQN